MKSHLDNFANQYYPVISEMIENQQLQYGLARIHSHRHISRCLIYSDWYCDYLGIFDEKERMKLYFAISLHDIGREGELQDVWENKSYQIYLEHLMSLRIDKLKVNNAHELIIVKNTKSVLNDIIHDVDCLDIMRSGAGRGGIMGFDKSYLNLFKEQPYIQDRLVSKAWQLINYSDSEEMDNVDCLKFIINKLKNEWQITT